MKEQVVLVDFENVQKLDMAQLPVHSQIKIFVGAQQTPPIALVTQALKLRLSMEWIFIDGNGPNALDFHIACYLGEGRARAPQAEFVIVSRDTGFDPLLRHLKARGLQCRRDAPATTAKKPPKPALDANAQLVVDTLKRMEKNTRPRKRKTLINKLVNDLRKKLSPEQVDSAIAQLTKSNLIGGADSALAYNF